MEMIENLIINKSTFCKKGDPEHSYRFTGFYYIYEFADGGRKLLPCSKEDANAIGGTGVCGAYYKFEDVEILERESKYLDGFTEEEKGQESEFTKQRIEESKKTVEFYKALPAGLTEKNVQDIHLDFIMDEMFKKK